MEENENTSKIPPFHSGSHYSSSGSVLFFQVRRLFGASEAIDMQTGEFDKSDRMFFSIAESFKGTLNLQNNVELSREIFIMEYGDDFLTNKWKLNFVKRQNGGKIDDVKLPLWAKNLLQIEGVDIGNFTNAQRFCFLNLLALEMVGCNNKIGLFLDLIFGEKQRGEKAKEALNVYNHLTYVDKAKKQLLNAEDVQERKGHFVQICMFGQCPQQLKVFKNKPFPKKHLKAPKPIITFQNVFWNNTTKKFVFICFHDLKKNSQSKKQKKFSDFHRVKTITGDTGLHWLIKKLVREKEELYVLERGSDDFTNKRKAILSLQKTLQTLITNLPRRELDSRNHAGETALFTAVKKGDMKTVKSLIHNGANVNIVNFIGNSLLHFAILTGNKLLFELLLKQRGIEVNGKNKDGFSALMLACHLGEYYFAHRLINHGANPYEKLQIKEKLWNEVFLRKKPKGKKNNKNVSKTPLDMVIKNETLQTKVNHNQSRKERSNLMKKLDHSKQRELDSRLILSMLEKRETKEDEKDEKDEKTFFQKNNQLIIEKEIIRVEGSLKDTENSVITNILKEEKTFLEQINWGGTTKNYFIRIIFKCNGFFEKRANKV